MLMAHVPGSASWRNVVVVAGLHKLLNPAISSLRELGEKADVVAQRLRSRRCAAAGSLLGSPRTSGSWAGWGFGLAENADLTFAGGS